MAARPKQPSASEGPDRPSRGACGPSSTGPGARALGGALALSSVLLCRDPSFPEADAVPRVWFTPGPRPAGSTRGDAGTEHARLRRSFSGELGSPNMKINLF